MKRILTFVALLVAASPLAFGQTAQSTPVKPPTPGKRVAAEQEVLKVGEESIKVLLGDAAALDRFWQMIHLHEFTGEVSVRREIEASSPAR